MAMARARTRHNVQLLSALPWNWRANVQVRVAGIVACVADFLFGVADLKSLLSNRNLETFAGNVWLGGRRLRSVAALGSRRPASTRCGLLAPASAADIRAILGRRSRDIRAANLELWALLSVRWSFGSCSMGWLAFARLGSLDKWIGSIGGVGLRLSDWLAGAS